MFSLLIKYFIIFLSLKYYNKITKPVYIIKLYLFMIYNLMMFINNIMGIGDWGLGIGD